VAEYLRCPSCGEGERLTGTTVNGDIQVTCASCGTTWVRGDTRCKTCGGVEVRTRPQAMSRTPRGNQRSVVGWRQVPLCPRCDHQAITKSETENRPVPEGYLSNFLLDRRRDVAAHARVNEMRAPQAAPHVASPSVSVPRDPPQRPRRRAASTSGRDLSPDPTVRQAVERFLTEGPGAADVTAMLLLSTHLGQATRLSDIRAPEATAAVAQWFNRTWPAERTGGSRRPALKTLLDVFDFWTARQWVDPQVMAALRVEVDPAPTGESEQNLP
jgi:hypothetical protein